MGTALALALLWAAPSGAQPSTAPVFGAPLRLRVLWDDRGKARGELGFSVRWDSSDLPGLPRRAAELAIDPVGTTARVAREALTGADVGVYTVRLKAGSLLPVDFLLSPLAAAAGWLSPETARAVTQGEVPSPPPAAPPEDPRRRLRLTPAREEIERSLKRDLHRSLVEAGFNLAVPVRGRVPYAQKEAVVDSLRQAGAVWEYELEERR